MSKKFTKLFLGDVVKTVGSRVFRKLNTTTTPTLITFTIGGTQYQAEEGMNWYEWCNSEYNTNGFYCWREDSSVETTRYSSTYVVLNGNGVIGTDTIISNATYTTQYFGGSND